jgi:pimeloyl-ACP methyl ester carboxylesterase
MTAFEQQCRACGSDVTRLPFPGLASYLGEPIESVIPRTAFSSVMSWMGAAAPRSVNLIPAMASAIIDAGTAHEEPIIFGPKRDLFGVLCRPRRMRRAGTPTLVFINTGVTRHTGDGRLFVEAARALAASGVASFRLDLAGIGDSAADPDRPGLLYDPRAQADVCAALDRLQLAGHRDFAILGICSGAHLALQVARTDRRVTAVVMVNIQTFLWSAGQSLKVERKNARRPTRYYLEAVLSRRGWARLSRADLALAPICLAILKRPLLDVRRRLALQAERRLGVATRFGSVRRWLTDLSDRHVDVRFWFGTDDQGLAAFASWFGPGGRDLRAIERVRTRLVAHTDHAMQSRQARRIFTDLLLEEIETGLGGTKPPVPVIGAARRLAAPVG